MLRRWISGWDEGIFGGRMSSVEHQRGWETKSDIVQFGSPVTAHILTTLSPPAPPPPSPSFPQWRNFQKYLKQNYLSPILSPALQTNSWIHHRKRVIFSSEKQFKNIWSKNIWGRIKTMFYPELSPAMRWHLDHNQKMYNMQMFSQQFSDKFSDQYGEWRCWKFSLFI